MFQDKIKRILEKIDSTLELSKLESAVEIHAEFKDRVFNKGLDKNEQIIGNYKPITIERKKRKGKKNITLVNLTDTTSLRKDIKVLREKSIAFSTEYGENVSSYNEKNFNKEIFEPSKKEKEIFIKNLNEHLSKLWK